jgi:hypothetical protein
MSTEAVEKQLELETLKKYGMKWAVLLSLSYDLSHKNIDISPKIIRELRIARVMLESGCFSTCDISCTLDKIDRELLKGATSLGRQYFDNWVNLLGRAIREELTPQDVKGLPFIRPVIHNCSFLQCLCEQDDSYETRFKQKLNTKKEHIYP